MTERIYKAIDLFCCAGGATRGLQKAGFHVTGVDKDPQKNYCGDAFILGDALDADLSQFDFVWASPPCQFASECTPINYRKNHPNLIPQTRAKLVASGKPYVIENVEGAKFHLINPIKLCGSMFGLPIFRHRYFESNGLGFFFLPPCNHSFKPILVSGQTKRFINGVREKEHTAAMRRAGLGVDWFINRDEASQAIPPAYSEFLGKQIIQFLVSNEVKTL